jgi:uncharacterized membrane protein YhhN
MLWMIIALILSWIGLLLINSGDQYVLLAVWIFLLANVGYTLAFRKSMDDNHEILLMKRAPLTAIVIGAIGALVFLKVRSEMGGLELPVLLYTIALLIMIISALNRHRKVSFNSFMIVLAGALVLLLSNAILALDQFNNRIPLASIWTVASYILAQYLIVSGSLLSGSKSEE